MVKKMYPELEGPFQFSKVLFVKFSNVKGLYLIALRGREYKILYPWGKHNTIYIGQSKDIGKRLFQHFNYENNWGLYNYLQTYPTVVYIKKLYGRSLLKKHENKMILDFENKYGCAPICNMKTGNPG